MDKGDLVRVDKRFAVETKLLDERGLAQETFFVARVRIDGVERHQAVSTGGVQDAAAGKEQLDAVR